MPGFYFARDGAVFGVSLLLTFAPQPASLGLNMWTAELVFVAAAFVMLAATLRKLAWCG